MAKRLALLVSLSCCLLFMVGPAFAEVQKFRHFSIDIPKECLFRDSGGFVTVKTGQGSFFSLGVLSRAEAGNLSAKDLADQLSKKLGGTAPTASDDGGWHFEAAQNGLRMYMQVMADKNYILMYMRDVSVKGWPDPLMKACNSIRSDKPDLDAFIKRHVIAHSVKQF